MTARFLVADQVPFKLVVEPQEVEAYAARFGEESLLVLPFRDQGLIAARNWIKAHSIEAGAERHWQLDDNIRKVYRRWKGVRIPCNSGPALAAVEDFTDRYSNVAVSGMNYKMFSPDQLRQAPFVRNVHVYSCSLINNAIPYLWRLRYNDDTDLCLQALTGGWCTLLVNVFLADKLRTMVLRGGNTDDLYRGDGRLKMARALERVWPGLVTTERRFKRPQHVVKWSVFKTPLRPREGVKWPTEPNEYGLKLKEVREVKSPLIRGLLGRD